MARCIAQIGRRTVKTLVSHGGSELFGTAARTRIVALRSMTTSRCLRAERLYTNNHEWVMLDGKLGTVGISDYAQDALGDVVYTQLPDVGSTVKKNEECGAVESVKAVSDLYSPISGEIVEKNKALENKPSLINTSCYEEGWLFKVKLSDMDEIKELMNEKSYNEFLKSSAH